VEFYYDNHYLSYCDRWGPGGGGGGFYNMGCGINAWHKFILPMVTTMSRSRNATIWKCNMGSRIMTGVQGICVYKSNGILCRVERGFFRWIG